MLDNVPSREGVEPVSQPKQSINVRIRLKGFVESAADPDIRHLLQAVGMRSDIEPHGTWPPGESGTSLVVIADAATVDRADVERRLDAALAR